MVEAAVSPDGATWTAIGTFNWSGPAGMYVGLAVTSHNQGALTRAQISQVQMR